MEMGMRRRMRIEMEMEMRTGMIWIRNLPSWLQYPRGGMISAVTQSQALVALWGHSGPFRPTNTAAPPALSHKLSLGCTRGLHGVENINCGFLVCFSII